MKYTNTNRTYMEFRRASRGGMEHTGGTGTEKTKMEDVWALESNSQWQLPDIIKRERNFIYLFYLFVGSSVLSGKTRF